MDTKTRAYLQAVIDTVITDQPVIDTLKQIPDDAAWALAIRQYTKKAPSDGNWSKFHAQWAWTEEEEKAFQATSAYTDLQQLTSTIAAKFKLQPGMSEYSLKYSTKARNLKTQIKYWNGNDTVAGLGQNLIDKIAAEFTANSYPEDPYQGDALDRFTKFLKKVSLGANVTRNGKNKHVTTPTHAVPGTSDHGRISAIDFHVVKGKDPVATTSTSDSSLKVWHGTAPPNLDFATALDKAVDEANDTSTTGYFDGPLINPPEPWHFTYKKRSGT